TSWKTHVLLRKVYGGCRTRYPACLRGPATSAGSEPPALPSRSVPVVTAVHPASEPRVLPALVEPDPQVAANGAGLLLARGHGSLPVPPGVHEQKVHGLPPAPLHDALHLRMEHRESSQPDRSPTAAHGASARR